MDTQLNDKYKPSQTAKELGAHISALGVKKSKHSGVATGPAWRAARETGQLSGVGAVAQKIAAVKLELSFGEAFIRGVFCNILVVLAVLMATMAKDAISKIVCIMLPIMTFVACGFEHCVANMCLITLGLLTGSSSFIQLLKLFSNLLPVTFGNIAGGIFILLIHPNRIRQLTMLYQRG